MKISELIEHLKVIEKENGDNDVWFSRYDEWPLLIKEDKHYCDGDEGEEPGLYIGI